jgi:hypothetical protein
MPAQRIANPPEAHGFLEVSNFSRRHSRIEIASGRRFIERLIAKRGIALSS